VRQCARLCVAVCGSVWQCMRQCAQNIYIHTCYKLSSSCNLSLLRPVEATWTPAAMAVALDVAIEARLLPPAPRPELCSQYISIRGTCLPRPATTFHMRAVEATQTAPSCTTSLTICIHMLWPALSCNDVRQCNWQCMTVYARHCTAVPQCAAVY
jgi:hypothetical protein